MYRSRFTAALLSAGAGIVHVAAAVPHFGEATTLGTGFLVVGWLQLVFAASLLAWPSRPLLSTGIALHGGAIAAYVVSRTVGLPIGHEGVEPLGVAGVVAVTLELAVVVVLVHGLSTGRSHVREATPMRLAVGGVGVVLLSLAGTTVAVADLSTPSDHHADEEAAHGERGDEGFMEPNRTTAESQTEPSAGHGQAVLHRHAEDVVHLHEGVAHRHSDTTVHFHPPPHEH